MRLAVVDGELAVGRSVVAQLAATGLDLSTAATAASMTSLLTAADSSDGFDVVLLDSRLGGLNAVDRHVRVCLRRGWPVVLHSYAPGSALAGQGIRAGAAATVSKFLAPEAMLKTLARVAAGRTVMDAWWARALLASGPVRGDDADVALLRDVAAGAPVLSLAEWHGRALSECEAGLSRVAERNLSSASQVRLPEQPGQVGNEPLVDRGSVGSASNARGSAAKVSEAEVSESADDTARTRPGTSSD